MKPDVLILANYASSQGISDGTDRAQKEQYADAMNDQISQWKKSGTKVVVLHDTPTAGNFISPACVTVSGSDCILAEDNAFLDDPQYAAANTLGIPTIDMTDYFCQSGTCRGVIGGIPVFYDTNHMSLSYNRTLAVPLQEKLLPLIK